MCSCINKSGKNGEDQLNMLDLKRNGKWYFIQFLYLTFFFDRFLRILGVKNK